MKPEFSSSKSDAESTIKLMDEAARANRTCSFLRGSLLELPPHGEVLFAGDLHGNLLNLHQLARRANLRNFPSRHLLLQELVHSSEEEADGLCRSYRLVETAARLKLTFPLQVHFLLGNHEMAELLDLKIGREGRCLNEAFDSGLEAAYGPRWRDVKEAYRRFWRSAALAARTENRILMCHSTPRREHLEGITLRYLRELPLGEGLGRKTPAYYMLWGRDYSQETADIFARQMEVDIFLVAHTKCENGYALPNTRHLILDSSHGNGCYILFPLNLPLTQADMVRRISHIGAL